MIKRQNNGKFLKKEVVGVLKSNSKTKNFTTMETTTTTGAN